MHGAGTVSKGFTQNSFMHPIMGPACAAHRFVALPFDLQTVLGIPARGGIGALANIKRVFIVTDDPDIIKEVKAYRGELQFVYVSGADREQLKRGSTEDIEKRLLKKDLKIDAGKMVLDALTDMTLLSHADVYIGHLQSNLSRLSFMLSTLRKRGFPPFISMDGSWCPHWRMCCDVHPLMASLLCVSL